MQHAYNICIQSNQSGLGLIKAAHKANTWYAKQFLSRVDFDNANQHTLYPFELFGRNIQCISLDGSDERPTVSYQFTIRLGLI